MFAMFLSERSIDAIMISSDSNIACFQFRIRFDSVCTGPNLTALSYIAEVPVTNL